VARRAGDRVQFNFGRAGAFGESACVIRRFLFECRNVRSDASVTWLRDAREAQLGECFLADLQARTRRPAISWNWTILGRAGRIFGGSRGAAELINVWRGCVGCTESVKMRCRMECVGAFWRQRLLGSPRGSAWLWSVHLDQRKIIDRPGPGEFGVIKAESGVWRRGASGRA